MRIYQMTATFGKLEHQTLTLEPGWNVITAPNEWGKSTWCAFLAAMLYGLDTRAKTTKTALADKERFSPWSGSPMSGRIDLNWNGRDITIERSSKRRIPLGEFKAYETETGLPVPELTAVNCGQMLLGVEQTVFRRAGFIRHADLPVTQDEALRRRLNALVTSGDESADADRLADQLKELKNRCRYNRTGLLPQEEAQRDALEGKIAELETLRSQSRNLRQRLEEVARMAALLQNHKQAIRYAKAQEDLARLEQARQRKEEACREEAHWNAICGQLPSREEAEANVRELHTLLEQMEQIREEELLLPDRPREPLLAEPFLGMPLEEARNMVRQDVENYHVYRYTKLPGLLLGMGIFGLLLTGMLVYLMAYGYAAVAGAATAVSLAWGIWEKITMKKKARQLLEKYGTDNPKRWGLPLKEYERKLTVFLEAQREFRARHQDLEERKTVLENKRTALCGNESLDSMLQYWQEAVSRWDNCLAARKNAQQTQAHFEALSAMVKPVEAPAMPDELTQSESETERMLSECESEQQRLHSRLGQYQGRMEALGDGEALEKQRSRQVRRIAKLEDTYLALTIAQETLAQARAELQRRFAPRITKRAQKLLARMTDGRYNALTMGQDFSLQARAGDEDVLSDLLWRSDGTMDQLYLALRLAVAEELTPNAPLVLDDALVRFDDARMKAAVGILKDMAKTRQIICFTCQGREAEV